MWGGFRFRLQKDGEAEWRWRDGASCRKFLGGPVLCIKSLGLDVYLTFDLWEL